MHCGNLIVIVIGKIVSAKIVFILSDFMPESCIWLSYGTTIWYSYVLLMCGIDIDQLMYIFTIRVLFKTYIP